ncbi:MAG: hypothetical protein ACK5O8_04125 [Pirellula sp.]
MSFFVYLLFLMFCWSSVAVGQVLLRLPDDEDTKTSVDPSVGLVDQPCQNGGD